MPTQLHNRAELPTTQCGGAIRWSLGNIDDESCPAHLPSHGTVSNHQANGTDECCTNVSKAVLQYKLEGKG